LDLSSAFDTVDHATILNVLHRRFGVQESVMDYLVHNFTSYMFDRTETFRLNGEMSSLIPLTCSVPQGSVLAGPNLIHLVHSLTQMMSHLFSRDIKSTIISMPTTSKRRLTGTHCPSALLLDPSQRRVYKPSRRTRPFAATGYEFVS